MSVVSRTSRSTPLPRVVSNDITPTFKWCDKVSGDRFAAAILDAYSEVVKWKRNVFLIPSGKVGELFVYETSRLLRAFGESTPLESIAFTAVMVMPHLLLQKPHSRSKVKDHVKCLERRLSLWQRGDISALLLEGRTIQQKLTNTFSGDDHTEKLAKSFSKHIRKGNVKSALRMLSGIQGSSLSARESVDQDDLGSKTVLEVLKEKHPEAQGINEGILIEAAELPFHPILFESIDGEAIRRAALHTEGSAGPSGIDSAGWRRMCTSFRKASSDLCNSTSSVAKRIRSEYLDPSILSSYTACRLIALSKNPGVRPIGVAEVLRRIISKAILAIIGRDIKEAAGGVQLCVGQVSGCEAGVHAMRGIFNDEETEAILLVDATNAFNSLNRKAALVNIHSLCPPLAVVATNMYRGDASLFIDGETVYSREGTTQGNPLAMSIYGIAILPLIQKLQGLYRQLWFADDASAGGKITQLKDWWTRMQSLGPSFGYHPNPSKTWLLAKEQHLDTAKEVFEDCDIHITSTGQRHLGSALGSDSFLRDFMATKISSWVDELENLSEVAKTEPQDAYAALTHGLIVRWTYFMRTTPGISDHMAPLEEVLRHKFIPAITGRKTVKNEER